MRSLSSHIHEYARAAQSLRDRQWHPRRDRVRVRQATTPGDYALRAHGGRERFPLAPAAFAQLCGRFGVTAELVGHLAALHPGAPGELLDRLLWQEGAQPTTRLRLRLDRQNVVQAVVRQAYQALDHLHVLRAVERRLGARWLVAEWHVGSDSMAIHVVHPDWRFSLAARDGYTDEALGGWALATGDRGGSALHIRPALYRTKDKTRLLFPHPDPVSRKVIHRDTGYSLARRLDTALTAPLPLAEWATAWRQCHRRFLREPEAEATILQWSVSGGKSGVAATLERWRRGGRPTLFRLLRSASAVMRDDPPAKRAALDLRLALAVLANRSGGARRGEAPSPTARPSASLNVAPSPPAADRADDLPDLPL